MKSLCFALTGIFMTTKKVTEINGISVNRKPIKGVVQTVVINPDDVVKMANTFATPKQIADFYMIDEEVFTSHFKDAYDFGHARGVIQLIQTQYDSAIKDKNTTMLRLLGEQVLGQKSTHHELLNQIEQLSDEQIDAQLAALINKQSNE